MTCLFVGVSLDRSGLRSLNGWSAAVRGVVGVAFGHAMLTNGRGMATVLKRRLRGTRDVGVVVLQSAVFVAILSAGLLSLLGRSVLAPLVPRSSDLSVALWTGIVVAAMGGWLIDATRGEIKHAERLAKSSHKSLDKALLAFAQKRCAETGTEWNFFLAVMLVENLQRPPWVRRLERSASRLRSQGTYGVMQVLSAEPISDTESVDLALGRHLGGFSVPSDPDVHGWAVISEKLRTYNGSEEYANQVCEIYQSLEDGSLRFK